MSPHPSTKSRWRVGYPDGSAHRIISDLSAFIGNTDPGTHRILAAGDLNMALSGTDNEDPWLLRERTVTDRMDALGLELLGPQYPDGRRADPTPDYLPPDTRNVPTYHTTGETPETADEPTRLGLRVPRIPPRHHRTRPQRRSKSGDRATTAGSSSKSPATNS